MSYMKFIKIINIEIFFLLLITLIFSSSSWSADPVSVPQSSVSYSPVNQIVKMVVGLMVVLGMIFVLAWMAKNHMGFNPSSNSDLKPLAGILVGQKERVVLVKVGDRQVLIGVAPGQINLIHVIERGDEVVIIDGPALSPFAEKLKRSLGRFDKS